VTRRWCVAMLMLLALLASAFAEPVALVLDAHADGVRVARYTVAACPPRALAARELAAAGDGSLGFGGLPLRPTRYSVAA
jgi:hypothetical protein